ncbi:MAG: glycosyltransferase family 4 protein [archaeon]|nr:glycosyltransferase family 4 protein [archaeon]
MKILEIIPFSSGFCGVWARAEKEAELLAKKGHEVVVFSSNIKRGTGNKEIAEKFDQKGKVKIQRFETFGNLGANAFFWDCSREAIELNPDVIITHAYRHYHSTLALKISQKLKIPCILVTHAPFLDKKLRSKKLNFFVCVYDNFIGKRIINKYAKIFAITKWEIPHLAKLNTKREKIVYSPNGIPEEFFSIKIPKRKSNEKILFLGRIAPIKDIETLIKAFKICSDKHKRVSLDFVGPIEEDYKNKILSLVKELNLEKKINFLKPVYDLKEKIKIIDSHDLFILPSKREGMPQALIEAMAREKIVISSKTEGGKEIVEDGKTGYLFDVGNESHLAEKIFLALKKDKRNDKIKKNAREYVKQFSWEKLIEKINLLIQNETKT